MKPIYKALLKFFVLIVAAWLYLNVISFRPPGWLERILFTTFYLLAYVLFIDIIISMIRGFYRRRKKLPYTTSDNFLNGLYNLRRLLIGAGLAFAPFSMLGLDLKTVLTSLSIVAAAVAIVSKDFIVDMIVGFHYSFSNGLEIGDYVSIGEKRGQIAEIGLLKLYLINDDDNIVIIPNFKAFSQEIVNYTKGDDNIMSVDFEVDINLIKSIETLENELIDCLHMYGDYIDPDSYTLRIEELKKDVILFKFKYKLHMIDPSIHMNIRKKTVRQVFNYITERRLKIMPKN